MQAWDRLRRDESGMSYAFVGVGLMAMLSASMLAIDVGMLMTARNQAQNSADAGAMAGALSLYFDDFEDRSPTGPAVTNAIAASKGNKVMERLDDRTADKGTVSVNPEDVVFQNDDAGQPTRVQVTVYRNPARGNPLSTLIAGIIGRVTNVDMSEAGVSATATAEASPSNAMDCIKPFTIPDRWIERTDPDPSYPDGFNPQPPRDSGPNPQRFDRYDKKGVLLPGSPDKLDEYRPWKDCMDCPVRDDFSGYNATRDKGMYVRIKVGVGDNLESSMFFSITLSGTTGADEYRKNIAECNTSVINWGDPMVQEPGAMNGPTMQGAQELIDRDPTAKWDPVCKCVKGSNPKYARSPRVFGIPLFDADHYYSGMRTGRGATLRVANFIGFFIDKVESNSVYAYITPIAGLRDRSAGDIEDTETALFPRTIRLVK